MKRRVLALVAAAAVLAPTAASAHLVVTGMGPLYDGISHFGLSPEDVLPVLALGLQAGLRAPRHARAALGALCLGWFLGGIVAMAGMTPSPVMLSLAGAAALLLPGIFLALNPTLPPLAGAALAAAVGLARGLSDMAGASASLAHVWTLLGMDACAFVAFAIAASLTLPLRTFWMIVAARVAGSWLAAIGLLLIGWTARYGAVL